MLDAPVLARLSVLLPTGTTAGLEVDVELSVNISEVVLVVVDESVVVLISEEVLVVVELGLVPVVDESVVVVVVHGVVVVVDDDVKVVCVAHLLNTHLVPWKVKDLSIPLPVTPEPSENPTCETVALGYAEL